MQNGGLFSLCFTLFCGLSSGQLFASSEYFKISRKWYGPGSTLYPHVVPSEVIRDVSVNVSQIFYNFALGKEFTTSGVDSYLMPGINIIFFTSLFIFLLIYIFKRGNIFFKNSFDLSKSQKKQENANYSINRSKILLFSSLVIIALSALPRLETFGNSLFGANLYKLIPLLNSVRLPGRLLPIADIGLILCLMSFYSNLSNLFLFKLKKLYKLFFTTFLITLILSQSTISARESFLEKGLIGKRSKTNPELLLNSNCDKFFRKIRKNNYGLFNLNENGFPETISLPKNLGDIPGYPRFVYHIFRSSLTLSNINSDKSGIANINRIEKKDFERLNDNRNCQYNGQTYIFENNFKNLNKFSSFISYPKTKELDENLVSESMEISNHRINFAIPIKTNQFLNSDLKDRPFLKVPFYPGWKIKTNDGEIFNTINHKNFIGFPDNSLGKDISEIFYSPWWIILIYLQLIFWLVTLIYLFLLFLKFFR